MVVIFTIKRAIQETTMISLVAFKNICFLCLMLMLSGVSNCQNTINKEAESVPCQIINSFLEFDEVEKDFEKSGYLMIRVLDQVNLFKQVSKNCESYKNGTIEKFGFEIENKEDPLYKYCICKDTKNRNLSIIPQNLVPFDVNIGKYFDVFVVEYKSEREHKKITLYYSPQRLVQKMVEIEFIDRGKNQIEIESILLKKIQ